MKRLIGITGGYVGKMHSKMAGEEFYLNAEYFDAVERAGGVPVPLPPCRDEATLREMVGRLDGLVFSGGPDPDPARYGQALHPQTKLCHSRRGEFDARCMAMALEMGLPVLGICYGCQLLNIHFGGTLVQDIPSLRPGAEIHRQDGPRVAHAVRVKPGSKLAECLGMTELMVNSAHHQAVDRLGAGLRVAARSADGIVEAVETTDDRFIIGVQWHPEDLTGRAEQLRLFEGLVEARR